MIEFEELPAETDLDISGIEHSVAFQLRRTQSLVFQEFLSRFSIFDLRPTEFCTLVLVAENPGRKQSEIASALHVQRANFVALINQLERRKLVERRSAPNDRRSNALYLTESGLVFMTEIRNTHRAFEAEATEKLGGPVARDHFLALLAKLSD